MRRSRVPVKRASLAVVGLVLAAAFWSSACGPQAGPRACPAALLTGRLEEVDELLAVRTRDGILVAVDWSNYAVHRDGDDLVVTDFGGAALAREGDFVNLGGGFGPGNSPFKVCGQVDVVPPP